MNFTLKRPLFRSAAVAALLAATALPAQAVVVHRYTFNDGNANDSVGTAHGTVVDPGVPTAKFTLGQLDLSANNGQTSGAYNALPAAAAPTEDAYVDLPNLIIENASKGGVAGAYSLEFWFTVATHRTWSMMASFAGPRNDGVPSENVINQGDVQYTLISPSSGRVNQGMEISADFGVPGTLVGTTLGQSGPSQPALPANVQHHVVGVWDKNAIDATHPGGTLSLFLNGVNILPGNPDVVGGNAIPEGFNPDDFNDEDNWLGRASWNDPLFDGSFNEFAVYDHAMTQAEVNANFAAGPVPVPLPTLVVNTTTGAAAIKNATPAGISIDYYEIASPGGRLNQATWNSLSDQNIDGNLAADFDDSGGAVNAADLAAWKAARIANNGNADADGDGDSDGHDFLAWQRQLGQSSSPVDGWEEAGGSGNNLLIETNLNGATAMAANQQFLIGSPFRTGGAQDLTFRFALAGGGLAFGNVQYVTSGPSTGVPEPATFTLAAAGLLGLAVKRRRAA